LIPAVTIDRYALRSSATRAHAPKGAGHAVAIADERIGEFMRSSL
jgi:hypothetical protein